MFGGKFSELAHCHAVDHVMSTEVHIVLANASPVFVCKFSNAAHLLFC